MKCMVTGAAGFIGSHLSEALVQRGDSVVGIDCFTDYYPKRVKVANLRRLRKEPSFRFVEADLSSANLSPHLRGVEYVFHLAAQPGVRASWGKSFSYYVKDNVVATQRLLEAVKQHAVTKFVYASSSSIYGDSERMPTPEDTLPKPVSPYGVTKMSGENLCNVYYKNYSVPVVSLRYFTVYGPRQRPDMAFNIFISRISRGEQIELYGDGEQRRDFTFVGDTVAANLLASKANPGEAYNVGSGRTHGLNEVISAIESIVGKKAKVRRSGKALGDVRNTAADITKITRDLGYRPSTTLLDGLKGQVDAQVGPRTA
jgi:nucleoside-diphosphate-sugar epimerase